MRRRRLQPAAWLARALAGGAIAAIAVAGLAIPGERGRYARAVEVQRDEVTRLAAAGGSTAPGGDRVLCARGVGGFAGAAAAAFGAGLRDADNVIVPGALAAVSGAAIEADRWAEQGGFDGATPGPALPQRVGLDAAGATVAPPTAACDGAPAFAQARISGRGLPAPGTARPGPGPSSTKKKPAKKPPKKAAPTTRRR